MSEYIEREALIDEFDRLGLGEHSIVERVFSDGVRTIIAGAPAADVAPVVHGRWTAQCVVETDGGWTLEDMPYNEHQHSNPICSICRKTALLDGGEDYVASPYCPNCGARMDGGSDG